MVNLNGKGYTVAFPLLAIRALEREMKQSVFQIFDSIADGIVGFDLMIAIIWAGILHNNRSLSIDTVSKWLDETDDLMPIFQECLPVLQESVMSHIHAAQPKDDTEKN